MGNHLLFFGQLKIIEKVDHRRYRQSAKLADIHSTDQNGQALLFQSVTMTLRTIHRVHPVGNFFPHPVGRSLPETTFEVVCHSLKLGVIGGFYILCIAHHLDLFAFGSIQKDVHNLFWQVFDRSVQREMIVVCKALEIQLGDSPFRIVPSACLDCTFPNGLTFIRDNQVRVDAHKGT